MGQKALKMPQFVPVKSTAMKLPLTMGLLFATGILLAQTDTTAPAFQFEDIDKSPVKRYASQKITGSIPNRFISIGYEYQGAAEFANPSLMINPNTVNLASAGGLRLAVNNPVISKNNLIISLGATYWRTGYRADRPNTLALTQQLGSYGMHSAGLNATVFKPLDEKHFLLFQASGDANIITDDFKRADMRAVTFSATAIYGWKPNEDFMWGLGVARTYRMGRILHIPVLMYNRNFNERWGVEAVFPARVQFRRNFNPKSMLHLGYELEGNQYAKYSGGHTHFVQRGEIKPRITWERSLSGFWWISLQAGLRANGRFVEVSKYDGKEKDELYKPTLGNTFFFNVSLNLVSL